MPKKIITAQRPFTMLIANVRAGADPAVANPVTMRSTFTRQLLFGRQAPSDRAISTVLEDKV